MVGTLVLGTSTEMCVGSSPTFGTKKYAGMMELVGMMDLKSIGQKCPCEFKSRSQYECLVAPNYAESNARQLC